MQLGRQQHMLDAHTSRDCVEAQRGNDAWQNEDVVNWPHQRLVGGSQHELELLLMFIYIVFFLHCTKQILIGDC